MVAASPDGSYLILSIRGRSDSRGGTDLYVTFRRDDASWSEPQNLGERVNSARDDWLSSVSPDGRYLFFTSFRYEGREYSDTTLSFNEWRQFNNGPQNGHGGDVYWVSTEVIEALKPAVPE